MLGWIRTILNVRASNCQDLKIKIVESLCIFILKPLNGKQCVFPLLVLNWLFSNSVFLFWISKLSRIKQFNLHLLKLTDFICRWWRIFISEKFHDNFLTIIVYYLTNIIIRVAILVLIFLLKLKLINPIDFIEYV